MTTGNAYKWSLIERVLNSAISFIGNLILVRLLTPDDFGLVAMVAVFIGIAYNFSSCGLCDGLIKKQSPTELDYSTVFVFNGAMGAFFGLLFIILAHPIADFYDYPELVGIMWAIGTCFFFVTLSFVQETKMRKELEMKKLALARLCATTTAIVLGIVMALRGMGYWAIVSTQVFVLFLTFVYMVMFTRWLPKIRFDRKAFSELFGFGVHLMLAYVFTMIGRNINTSVLGRYSANASGVFSQAQKLEEVPYTTIENSFNATFFVVLSNESQKSQRRIVADNMHRRFIVLYSSLALLMILLSAPVISVLYGSQWLETIPVFRILCVFGFIYSMKSFYQAVIKSCGLSKFIRNATALEVGIQLSLLAMFFSKGILYIAWTQVLAVAIITALYVWKYKKSMEVGLKSLLHSLFTCITPAVFAFVVSVFVCYIVDYGNDFGLLALGLFSYVAVLVPMVRMIQPDVYFSVVNKLKKD